jgi:hypothetical protein
MSRRREMRRGIWKEEIRLVSEHVPLSESTDTIRGRKRSAFTIRTIYFNFILGPKALYLSALSAASERTALSPQE